MWAFRRWAVVNNGHPSLGTRMERVVLTDKNNVPAISFGPCSLCRFLVPFGTLLVSELWFILGFLGGWVPKLIRASERRDRGERCGKLAQRSGNRCDEWAYLRYAPLIVGSICGAGLPESYLRSP